MRIKFLDFVGLLNSFMRNDNTLPRVYQFPDKDMTVAGTDDITAANVGLGNVDNTSDADKPISDDTQAALDLKVDESNKQQFMLVCSLKSLYNY